MREDDSAALDELRASLDRERRHSKKLSNIVIQLQSSEQALFHEQARYLLLVVNFELHLTSDYLLLY